ncbi:striatin-4-like [Copidosoma floridanum]|uniref:striatin-4-like n=1 Tax=Copidosoma floridanum TaxID=29053 RepID=UPI000C6F73ED|nr:striatin-4-like [Copidosoma floridanum]
MQQDTIIQDDSNSKKLSNDNENSIVVNNSSAEDIIFQMDEGLTQIGHVFQSAYQSIVSGQSQYGSDEFGHDSPRYTSPKATSLYPDSYYIDQNLSHTGATDSWPGESSSIQPPYNGYPPTHLPQQNYSMHIPHDSMAYSSMSPSTETQTRSIPGTIVTSVATLPPMSTLRGCVAVPNNQARGAVSPVPLQYNHGSSVPVSTSVTMTIASTNQPVVPQRSQQPPLMPQQVQAQSAPSSSNQESLGKTLSSVIYTAEQTGANFSNSTTPVNSPPSLSSSTPGWTSGGAPISPHVATDSSRGSSSLYMGARLEEPYHMDDAINVLRNIAENQPDLHIGAVGPQSTIYRHSSPSHPLGPAHPPETPSQTQSSYPGLNTASETDSSVNIDRISIPNSSKLTQTIKKSFVYKYLQEIGYTDTIIDVRSNRVKSLLGLNNNTDSEETNTQGLTGNQRCNLSSKLRTSAGVCRPTSMAEAMIMKTEAAVMANFEFLAHTDIDIEEDENDGEEEIYDSNTDSKQNKTSIMLGEDVDAEAEEVLNELNLLTEHEEAIIHVDMDTSNWNAVHRGMQSDPRRPGEESGSSLGLGELAQLTVNNDAEAAYDIQANNEEPLRKSWNAKYTLRSHFDGVRALVFHPTEPVLITGSDDHTLKLWNLQKTVPAKKSASLDVEPLYTFRSHTGPVLCLAMDNTGSHCYSGGLDSKIHCWTLPPANIDPYDSYDPSLLSQTFTGHTDAVWGLSMCHSHSQLLSVSADGTVKLWSLSSKVPLLNTYTSERDRNPTSVDFIRDEPHKLVVAYEEACVIYDAETGVVVSRLSGNEIQGVNRLVAHPILSLVVAANEDRHIRFYDHRSASLVHAMVAHLDAVTSLAVDPNGLYLLSGSHDCSIRLWNMDNKTCVQEITAHRKKFDESILDVAFHPSRPFIASAGADALAKVFV